MKNAVFVVLLVLGFTFVNAQTKWNIDKSIKKVAGKKFKLVGDFTIRDVTKSITLDVVYNGSIKDPWGNTKAGFKITGELNRFDYNLKWNNLMEAGGAVVGKEVTITVNLELSKAK